MNVLSIFDGVSCGHVALERAGIPVDNYFACEIDKYAVKVTSSNYPNTMHLGDVTRVDVETLPKIDLLLAGFPCQAWSLAGKQKGDSDPRGALVHDLIRIWQGLKRKNPDLKFLFENVKMKKEFLDYINDLFGVEPILINSALVSAQNRKRYYWTNIEGVTQPEDMGIMLKDIVHENIDTGASACMKDKAYTLTASYNGAVAWNSFERRQRTMLFEKLQEYIVPFDKTLQILDREVQRGKIGYFRKDSQANRVYYIHGKSVTLCGDAGGGAAKMGQYLFGCTTPDTLTKNQNGQIFNDGKKFYTLTARDRHGVLVEGYIRKLTPVECCRLQTLPDDYFDKSGISKSQRYKCIGNGWTVDVIAHIFKNLK